jgi:hypothetical protein
VRQVAPISVTYCERRSKRHMAQILGQHEQFGQSLPRMSLLRDIFSVNRFGSPSPIWSHLLQAFAFTRFNFSGQAKRPPALEAQKTRFTASQDRLLVLGLSQLSSRESNCQKSRPLSNRFSSLHKVRKSAICDGHLSIEAISVRPGT